MQIGSGSVFSRDVTCEAHVVQVVLWSEPTLSDCVHVLRVQTLTEPEDISMSDVSLQPTRHLPSTVRPPPPPSLISGSQKSADK